MTKLDIVNKLNNEIHMTVSIYTKVKELFSGIRLLYIPITFFIGGLIFLYFEIKNIQISYLPIDSILYGLCFGSILGILTIWELSRNIIGTFYYRPHLSWKGILSLIIIGILLSIVNIYLHNYLQNDYHRYVLLPCCISIPIGSLINIIWLINYEKHHGEVYIISKKG